MELVLKPEYLTSDIIINFTEKGQKWHYTLKRLKPSQYQKLYENGYSHLFEVVGEEDMPLFSTELDEEEVKSGGLVDYTSNKKKAVTAKKNNK